MLIHIFLVSVHGQIIAGRIGEVTLRSIRIQGLDLCIAAVDAVRPGLRTSTILDPGEHLCIPSGFPNPVREGLLARKDDVQSTEESEESDPLDFFRCVPIEETDGTRVVREDHCLLTAFLPDSGCSSHDRFRVTDRTRVHENFESFPAVLWPESFSDTVTVSSLRWRGWILAGFRGWKGRCRETEDIGCERARSDDLCLTHTAGLTGRVSSRGKGHTLHTGFVLDTHGIAVRETVPPDTALVRAILARSTGFVA